MTAKAISASALAKTGCDVCNKSSVSLLLLRPSPIANEQKLRPTGASAIQSAAILSTNLLPTPSATQSIPALRLLRAGYVYAYLPSPPEKMSNWLVWRVMENGDVYPESNPVFNQAPPPPACSRTSHNAAGMKLIGLPRAHEIKELWLSYSANLWTEKLKAQNKANPLVMQLVPLGARSTHTFIPTANALKSQVLECALQSLSINKAIDHDYPFFSLSSQADQIAAQLTAAAACHPKTTGWELAVVLPDPVAYVTELNALRLRRNEMALQETEKPEIAHPLNSSHTLMGMKQAMVDEEEIHSFERVSPLRTKTAFDAETWPSGTVWEPLDDEQRRILLDRADQAGALARPLADLYKNKINHPSMGRVIYPDSEARARAWTEDKAAATWAKLSDYYDETARASWMKAFEARMKAEHYLPLEKYEADWIAAKDAPLTVTYFQNHFDEDDPNDTLKLHSPGLVYAKESYGINSPEPFTTGRALDQYLAGLEKPITDPQAIAQRAIAGNQKSVIAQIHQQLTGDSGAEEKEGGGLRDKSYDVLKGFAGSEAGEKMMRKYSWMGHAIGMLSVGQLSALSAAAVGLATRSSTLNIHAAKLMGKAQNLWAVQQALEMSAQGALTGTTKLPVLISVKVDSQKALAILRQRPGENLGTSRRQIRRRRAGVPIKLTLLTDTEAIKAAAGNIDTLLADTNSANVKFGQASASVRSSSAAWALSEENFLRLYAGQSTISTRALGALRASLATGGGLQARTLVMTLEGRLALGCLIVQGIGLYNGLKAVSDAQSQKDLRDAWYGVWDSTAGVLGGLMETWAVAVTATTAARAVVAANAATGVAETAVGRSMGIASLRFLAGVTGIAGGIVNAASNWAKAEDAKSSGDESVAKFYAYSGVAFGTAGFTSFVGVVGVVADVVAKRAATGAVTRLVAVRIGSYVGVEGALLAVGGTAITVSGIGLVLLGIGIAFQVTAIAITPSDVQRWMARSYFGRDPSMFSFSHKREDAFFKGDWAAEQAALNKIISP